MSPNIPTTRSFGRGLSPFCAADNATDHTFEPPSYVPGFPRSVSTATGIFLLVGVVDAYQTVNNVSTIHRIITANRGDLSYVFLSAAQIPNDIDYVASTVAINTQCTPITSTCNVTIAGGQSTPYYCSSGFHGDFGIPILANSDLGSLVWRMNFFNDSGLTEPVNLTMPTNPTYMAMASYVVAAGLSDDGKSGNSISPLFSNDPEIAYPCCLGGIAFILRCNTTVYEATYSWVNNSFGSFISLTQSNLSLSNIINGPQQNNNTFGIPQYVNGATLSAFSNTSQELADKMALVYSQTALGLAAGVLSPRQNLEEQTRQTLLIARVPYAPFYTLLILNLLYVVTGVVFGFLAIRANGFEKVRDIKAGLSIWGLLEHGFDGGRDVREVQLVEGFLKGIIRQG